MFTQNDLKQGDFIVEYQGMLYMLYIICDSDPKSVDLCNFSMLSEGYAWQCLTVLFWMTTSLK